MGVTAPRKPRERGLHSQRMRAEALLTTVVVFRELRANHEETRPTVAQCEPECVVLEPTQPVLLRKPPRGQEHPALDDRRRRDNGVVAQQLVPVNLSFGRRVDEIVTT